MNKILDNLYVTDIAGVQRRDALQEMGIDFVIDVRVHFGRLAEDMTPRDTILKFAWGILGLMDQGYKVVLHCHGGIDRSPFVAAVVVKLYHGSNMEYAYNKVKEARPQTFIHDDWVRLIGLD